MSLQINKKVAAFLKQNPESKFTARQIAEWIFETYPEECRKKQENSTATVIPLDNDKALVQQIIREIGARRTHLQKTYPFIKSTDSRPRKFYHTEKSDEAEIQDANEQSTNLSEHDMYPILVEYLKAEHQLYSKRIDEKFSSNKRGSGGNEWLHPDLVALEDLASEWENKITQCAKQYGDKFAKLWSFEVKKKINLSNVRSAFFQAVSNSSWANYGYLVAGDLDDKAKKELRMLSGLHGIGFILLDMDNPSESQIQIPARERTDLDWESINRLAEVNADFMDYIEEVNDFCLTGKTKAKDWD